MKKLFRNHTNYLDAVVGSQFHNKYAHTELHSIQYSLMRFSFDCILDMISMWIGRFI